MRLGPVIGLLLAISLTGCVGAEAPVKPSQPERQLAGKIYGDAEAGRVAMERWCISCHKATGPMTDQPAPPLSVLAAHTESSARAIRAFLMHPHSPMPPLELSNQMIEDIIAYLRHVGSAQATK